MRNFSWRVWVPFVIAVLVVGVFLFAAVGCELQLNAAGNGKGDSPWNASQTYSQGDLSIQYGIIFSSLENNNTGNPPVITPLKYEGDKLVAYVGSPQWNGIGQIQ